MFHVQVHTAQCVARASVYRTCFMYRCVLHNVLHVQVRAAQHVAHTGVYLVTRGVCPTTRSTYSSVPHDACLVQVLAAALRTNVDINRTFEL